MALLKKFKILQGFRGFAALLVVVFHATVISRDILGYEYLHGLCGFGYAGVDFFFVLSGFIIMYVHSSDIGQKNRLGRFLLKRFTRLYPIYWVVCLAIIPVYFLNHSYGLGYEREPAVIIKSLLLIPQIRYPILNVAWSLSFEVWFYALFGLAILWGRRISVASYGCWIACVLILFVGGFFNRAFVAPFPLAFILSRFNLEFSLGCLAAYIVMIGPLKHPSWWLWGGAVFFVTAGLFDKPLRQLLGMHHEVLSYGLASVMLVLGAASGELSSMKMVPSWLVYLGDASYSIYLTHYLSLSVLMKLLAVLHIGSAVTLPFLVTLMAIIAIGLGCLCYSLLERPLLNSLKTRLLPKRVDLSSSEQLASRPRSD